MISIILCHSSLFIGEIGDLQKKFEKVKKSFNFQKKLKLDRLRVRVRG
jgi:hypothetical protein